MKSPISFIIILLGLLNSTTSFGQILEADILTYQAYLEQNIQKAKESWKEAVRKRDQEFKANPNDQKTRYRLALAQFGLLNASMRDKDESLFDEYQSQTEEQLERLLKDKNFRPEVNALLASLYGLQIGFSSWKGVLLGSKSRSLMEEALKESPSSPLIWKLYGNSKLFAPEMFGGDINEAIRAYEKAIQLFQAESNGARTKDNWFYLDTIAFLGQAYARKGDFSKAILWYEKALQIAPEYGWVKYTLLPEAKKLK